MKYSSYMKGILEDLLAMLKSQKISFVFSINYCYHLLLIYLSLFGVYVTMNACLKRPSVPTTV